MQLKKAAEAPRTKATGKRALTEAEEAQYEKRTRRKLLVDPPAQKLMAGAFKSARTRRKLLVDPPAQKLMAGAFKSASGGEEQESAVASRPDRADPHSGGSTFSEGFSPHRPLDQAEGGDEFPSGDMGASPATDPDISPFPDQTLGAASSPAGVLSTTSPSEGVKLPTDEMATDEFANLNESQSPASSILLPPSGTNIPSPTTGRLTQVDTTASSPGLSAADDDEPLDYGSSSHHDDDADEDDTDDDEPLDYGSSSHHDDDADEDDSDDDDFYDWAHQPPPPPDKASGYLPFYPTGSPTPEAAGTPSSLHPQAADVSPFESMSVTTSSLPEEPLSLTIPLKPVGTEIVLSSTQKGALMALPSSPSQLDITIASPTSSRSSPTAFASGSMLLGSPSTSPMKSLSPVAIPSILKALLRPLEDMMKIAIEEISAGRASFDFFKPILMNSLNNVRYVDDARLFQHCSEGISRLEKDLRALEELHQADLAAQAALVFGNLQAEAARQYESFQEAITERELKIASVQGQCIQKQHAVDASGAAILRSRLVYFTFTEA
ncbi:uncharacterized protein LOC109821532 [Asparagus officinalis]|uniref:uncharacterized protein LOC109821532 n=1 Tax=Asparagus officinalis TaxID=4686 RepID=UPI00098E4840|nr:uncharacterized protein LOC109821532 [Asparagus officinalis]